MDAEELRDARLSLRDFAEENGLGWLLAELDEAVAVGVVEVKALRQASRRGEQVYEEVSTAPQARGRKRAEEFLTRRPMTEQEQVEDLIAALQRVLVDVDLVAQTAVEQLAELQDRAGTEPASTAGLGEFNMAREPWLPIQEVDFLPDEGSSALAVTTEGFRHDPDRRAQISAVLLQLLAAVRE